MWQPYGEQFGWACRVCARPDPLRCNDCKCEKQSGFVFDPDLFIKLCREMTEEKYYFDGEQIRIIKEGNRVFELEDKLKQVEEDRNYWRSIADKALREIVNIVYKLVDSKIK